MTRGWKRAAGVALTCAGAAVAWLGWQRLRPLPAPTPGDAARGATEFYDSDLGSAPWSAIPTSLFEAIPELFPDLMPEGWEGVGLFWREPGDEGPPVGTAAISLLGIPSRSSNCALCHAGRFNGMVVAGMPNTDFDVELLTHTLQTAVMSGRLTADAVADVWQKRGRPISAFEKWSLARIIELAKGAFDQLPKNWFHDDVGPGRADALEDWKVALGVKDTHQITWVDLPAIFNQRLKTRTLYDGAITGDMSARIMLTEIRKGRPARDALLHREVFDDLVAWMNVLSPPPYPFVVDQALATRGHGLFDANCSSCHGTYGVSPTYPNKRIDVTRVGTDPERAKAMDDGVTQALSRHAMKGFLQIEPRLAYMPPALNGVYMTAPYLHNGSVPTLWHLLQPPEKRPLAFFRRWNEFDSKRVGFACVETQTGHGLECAPDASQKKHDPRTVWRYDARKIGNLNGGHLFGTELSDDEKVALIEYLKTI